MLCSPWHRTGDEAAACAEMFDWLAPFLCDRRGEAVPVSVGKMGEPAVTLVALVDPLLAPRVLRDRDMSVGTSVKMLWAGVAGFEDRLGGCEFVDLVEKAG